MGGPGGQRLQLLAAIPLERLARLTRGERVRLRAGDRVLGRQVLRRAPRPLLPELQLKPPRAVLRGVRTRLPRDQ